MKISQFDDIINKSKQVWINSLNDPTSIFFRGYRTEEVFKKMFPRFRKNKTLKLLKLIKLEALKMLSDPKRYGVYVCQSYWAKKLECDQPRISRILHRLEELGVIKLSTYALNSSKKTNRKCRNKILIENADLPMSLTQLPMSLHFRSAMISSIYDPPYQVTNYQDYNHRNSSPINTNVFIEQGRKNFLPLSNGGETFLTKKGIRMKQFVRYELKPKPTYSDYGLSPTDFFGHIKSHALMEKCLTKLINKEINPMTEETERIIDHWNGKKNKKFAGIRSNPNSRRFKEVRIMVSFAIYFHMVPFDQLIKAIDLFDNLSKVSRFLKFAKQKFSLHHNLLSNIKHSVLNKSWLDICTMTEQQAIAKCCGTQVKFTKTFNERIKPSFIEHFYAERKSNGLEAFEENYELFAEFSDRMVNKHQNLKMCSLKINELIDAYFDFIVRMSSNWRDNAPTVKFITKKKWFPEFVLYKAHQPGWEEFGKDLPKENEGEE